MLQAQNVKKTSKICQTRWKLLRISDFRPENWWSSCFDLRKSEAWPVQNRVDFELNVYRWEISVEEKFVLKFRAAFYFIYEDMLRGVKITPSKSRALSKKIKENPVKSHEISYAVHHQKE